jgi:hypothetical protein
MGDHDGLEAAITIGWNAQTFVRRALLTEWPPATLHLCQLYRAQPT